MNDSIQKLLLLYTFHRKKESFVLETDEGKKTLGKFLFFKVTEQEILVAFEKQTFRIY